MAQMLYRFHKDNASCQTLGKHISIYFVFHELHGSTQILKLSTTLRCLFFVIPCFYVVGRFLAEVNATGTGTELDPYQQYAKQENEVVLQCKYESGKLVWDKYVNSQWTVIASGDATINTTKYSVSFNPNTGLYYILHILPAQSSDEAIYRCIGGLSEVYFIQLTLLGKHLIETCFQNEFKNQINVEIFVNALIPINLFYHNKCSPQGRIQPF